MAYTDGMNLVIIRGNLGSAEVWSNTWAIDSDPLTVDYAAVRDAFQAFYSELATGAAPIFGEEWSAVSYQRRDLFVGATDEPSWEELEGTNGADMLPYECALRISLTAGPGHRGGPFLAGMTVESLQSTGGLMKVAYQNVIHDALSALVSDLGDANAALGLHRPTTTTVGVVGTYKVGQVFDVIRRRRNQQLESYLSDSV